MKGRFEIVFEDVSGPLSLMRGEKMLLLTVTELTHTHTHTQTTLLISAKQRHTEDKHSLQLNRTTLIVLNET